MAHVRSLIRTLLGKRDQILIARLHKYKSVPSPRVENNKRAYTASLPEDDGTTPEPKKILDGREPSPASLML